MEKGILLLLILLVLEAPTLLSQGNIIAKIYPNSISLKPGEKVKFLLTVMNGGNVDINVTGVRVHVRSKTIFGVPISIYLGEYPIPFEKPVKVRAGGETAIEKVVEVPNIPIAGSFDLELIVQTTGGVATTHMFVSLSYSLLSLLILFVAILLLAGILYLIYMYLRRKIRRRPEEKIDNLLKERNKYADLLRKLEEKKSRGEIGSEYEKLREEYSSRLAEVRSRLDEAAKQLQIDLDKISIEINKMEEEIKILKTRIELGELSKDDKKEIKRKEDLLMKKKEILLKKKALLDRIKEV